MAHLQYIPGDPRLVDQLIYELKSKGIFDQFRKDCIADVDTKPAYQNLRQRVESSVAAFLARQCWQPDLNKNQLREKLRKHILDGNYLEQGVERIVDQVVNPKIASVFIPQVEDLVCNYLGITRKKTVNTNESSTEKVKDLLPTDLEAVSPGSVKSNDENDEKMEMDEPASDENKMDIDPEQTPKVELKDENISVPDSIDKGKENNEPDAEKFTVTETVLLDVISKCEIPMPAEDFKIENIPPPKNCPPIELEKIELPKVFPSVPDSIIMSTDIPLPDEIPRDMKEEYFKPINSDEDESSSDSSLRRNMSPLTPIRNFNNENSCDAQQAFDNDLSDSKNNEKKEPNTFRFAIETKSTDKTKDSIKAQKKDEEQSNLSYQFSNQVNINNFNTPLYEDSSNSNNLQIDYESDANSKVNTELKVSEESVPLEEGKKDRKVDEKKSSHKSSHRSRDSSKHSSSRDKRSDSKPSSSRDSSRHDKKPSRDDHNKLKSSHKDKSSDRSDKKDTEKKERDTSRYRSSHKTTNHKDSRDTKSHKSSSSSQRHSSKHSDDKKSSSSSNHKEKSEKSSEKSSDKSSKNRSSKDSKSSSHRSDKDRKSSSSKSSSKHDEKDKDKKNKKETDDHYSVSGRGNTNRRSTDRDSNDGSSSSKGSHNPSSSKSSTSQKDGKGSTSKSDNTSPSGESTCPSDKEQIVKETKKSNADVGQPKPIVRIDTRLELPMASPPRLPFVPDVTLRKPKFAANLEEAKKLMRMRRFLDEEQKRMNQEAALLLEFQANVRPSLSQVYSSIPGPELEFACVANNKQTQVLQSNPAISDIPDKCDESITISNPTNALLAVVNAQKIDDITGIDSELSNLTESNDSKDSEGTELQQRKANEKLVTDEDDDINNLAEARVPDVGNEIKKTVVLVDDSVLKTDSKNKDNDKCSGIELDLEQGQETRESENDERTEYFEITVITEELSENEDNIMDELKNCTDFDSIPITGNIKKLPLDNNNTVNKEALKDQTHCHPGEPNFRYFTSNEKYEAELERVRFSSFLKTYTEKHANNKIYLINCDTYEESVVKGVLETYGTFEVVNYLRNGHLKLPKTSKSIIKNVNVASEVSLPFDNNEFEAAANELEMDLKVTRPSVLSPAKSECSFELSSDYDAKINEMVNNASRQEIMEIILGNAMSNESPSKMPTIDYVNDCNIETEAVTNLRRKISDIESKSEAMVNVKRSANEITAETEAIGNLKRKINEIEAESENLVSLKRTKKEIESESEAVINIKRRINEFESESDTMIHLKKTISEIESSVNNNRPVLTPKKMRKISASDQITSTTQESEVPTPNALSTRSKYLGRVRRVGLPRPRKSEQPNSPFGDKPLENYSRNAELAAAPATPNGKLRVPPRNKIQRYDTSDLYKPKLHYLSRRNNIS